MKLRAIRLENVRRFIAPVEITGIGDGLNVLAAPNEHGKSTVLDALHAMFFKDRKSWDKEVRSLQPHAGGEPRVTVEIEIAGSRYRIEKHWTRGRAGEVRVWQEGRLHKQADAAEAWLSATLTPPREGGPAGLLWVRQGMTPLETGGDGRVARRDLLASVAGEVEAVTGGRRMERALADCGAALSTYLTATGRPKAEGPLKQALDEVAELEVAEATLSEAAERLSADLAARRRCRAELADIEDAEAVAARAARLEATRARLAIAESHAARLKDAEAAAERAERDLALAEDRVAALAAQRAELSAARQACDAAQEATGMAITRRDAARAALEAAETAYRARSQAAQDAAHAVRRASRAKAAAEAAERRAALVETLTAADGYRRALEAAQAKAKQQITTEAWERIDACERARIAGQQAQAAAAPSVTMRYLPGKDGRIDAGGTPLPEGTRRPVTAPLTLDLPDLGTLTVTPGALADSATTAQAEADLAQALDAAGVASVEEARHSLRLRAEADATAREAAAALAAVAPKGIEELQAAIAALPDPETGPTTSAGCENETAPRDDSAPLDLVAAETAEAAARAALTEADIARETARHQANTCEMTTSAAQTALAAAQDRLRRAEDALADFTDPEAETATRIAERDRLRLAARETETAREALAREAPDLTAAQAAFDRAQAVVSQAERDRQRLRVTLGELTVAIDLRAGEAVEEELADTRARLAEARARRTRLDFEVAVLKRLKTALEDARAAARDRYVAPIQTELAPLLRLVWGGDAALRIDAEAVLPAGLDRNGAAEDFEVLSGGTQEQIALLVRLAFARLLAKSGNPAPVILDDAIVYTDDDRIERMFDALTRQAQDLQILVFSCRQKAFRDLGGHSLSIRPAAEDGGGAN
jgi:DNA repair exonuclease SbcCD ATPase subunit